MSEQESFWAGEFGVNYTHRNRVSWMHRVPFWEDMLLWLKPATVLEVGCNAGWNLQAIQSIDPACRVVGIEINSVAAEQAKRKGFPVQIMSARNLDVEDAYDLVFTAGVLIHIPPSEIRDVMSAIVRASSRYVVAIEYEDDEEVEVEYRGHSERLWRRPYGELYEDLGLRIIEAGHADGFDRCTYWLMEKK